jgi:hypothetical protein
MIEPRRHSAVSLVLREFAASLDASEWTFVLIGSRANAAWLANRARREITHHRVEVRALPKDTLTRDEYSKLLMIPQFWESLPRKAEHVLIFKRTACPYASRSTRSTSFCTGRTLARRGPTALLATAVSPCGTGPCASRPRNGTDTRRRPACLVSPKTCYFTSTCATRRLSLCRLRTWPPPFQQRRIVARNATRHMGRRHRRGAFTSLGRTSSRDACTAASVASVQLYAI